MEKFYLEKPSIERKKEIIEYIDELIEYDSDFNGLGPLYRMIEGYSFEEALESCLLAESEEYAIKIGRRQSKTYLLVRKNDNRVVGAINIRWNLRDEKLQFGGHIGYGIRPTERKKGYSKINLYLGIIEAKKMGLDKIMLDCEKTNIASNKTLKALGGKLTRTEVDPIDGILTNIYWFNMDKTIKDYKETYNPLIYNNIKQ